MATKLKSVDALTVGVGWTGGIIAAELTKAGLHVVGLERGEYRNTAPDFQIPQVHDELSYGVRLKLMQDAAVETVTFRNDASQTALPLRYFISFLPGTGLGGAGVHWGVRRWLAYSMTIPNPPSRTGFSGAPMIQTPGRSMVTRASMRSPGPSISTSTTAGVGTGFPSSATTLNLWPGSAM